VAETNENLTKICVNLEDAGPFETESLWAKPLGNDLYEVRNSPWFAFDLHFYDVVRAVAEQPGEKPKITEVVSRSRHKTLRVLFDPKIPEAERVALLNFLHRWRAFHENADGRLYAVDVEPDGDYSAVCDQLWAWQQEGKLLYETGTTCDEPGSP
jgi:hypothetical protein